MNLTESEILQERIAGMSGAEFEEWLAGQIEPHVTEAYSAGYEGGYAQGYADGDKDEDSE